VGSFVQTGEGGFLYACFANRCWVGGGGFCLSGAEVTGEDTRLKTQDS
jgi:hypothetical protein